MCRKIHVCLLNVPISFTDGESLKEHRKNCAHLSRICRIQSKLTVFYFTQCQELFRTDPKTLVSINYKYSNSWLYTIFFARILCKQMVVHMKPSDITQNIFSEVVWNYCSKTKKMLYYLRSFKCFRSKTLAVLVYTDEYTVLRKKLKCYHKEMDRYFHVYAMSDANEKARQCSRYEWINLRQNVVEFPITRNILGSPHVNSYICSYIYSVISS